MCGVFFGRGLQIWGAPWVEARAFQFLLTDIEFEIRTAAFAGENPSLTFIRCRANDIATPKDFLDLGSRAAVDQALSRLAKSGDLRRVGRGLYDLPRMSGVLHRPAPVDMDSAVAALARRDSVRIMPDGIAAANQLGLTNAVPAKASYVTDGATRNVKIGNRTVRLRHAGPSVMAWAGKSSAPVAQALRWLGPQASSDTRVAATLKNKLPDAVKKDLVRNSAGLPSWAAPVVRSLADSQITA